MATISDQQKKRDARLDALKVAAEKWATEKAKQQAADVKFLKSVLKGRTGAGRLAAAKTAKVAKAVSTEVEAFLTG